MLKRVFKGMKVLIEKRFVVFCWFGGDKVRLTGITFS